MKKVTIYTDGACKGNPGPGGWGAVLQYGDRTRRLHGGDPATTNNRMELTAAIEALDALKERCEVTLFTDSVYVMNGLTQWLPNWKKRHWRTADGKPVKNQELWQRLDLSAARHAIDWRWVKGHNGDPGNEEADRLANEGVRHGGAMVSRESAA